MVPIKNRFTSNACNGMKSTFKQWKLLTLCPTPIPDTALTVGGQEAQDLVPFQTEIDNNKVSTY